MSEVRRVALSCTLAVALLGSSASAQGVGTGIPLRDPAIERANAARLASLAVEAVRQRKVADSIRKFVQFSDTVREGRIRIATTPEFVEFARTIAQDAEASLARTFGPSADVAPMTFVMRGMRGDQGPKRARLERWISDTLEGAIAIRLVGEPGVNGPAFLVAGFAKKQFGELDSATRAWLQHPLHPAGDRKLERSVTYVEMATSDNRIVRDCHAGSLARCRDAFAFEQPADPVMSWYEPSNRRRMVTRVFTGRRRDPVFERCAQGDDQACITELRSWMPSALPPPLDDHARQSLVWVALELGGDGALKRLESSTAGTVDQRLADAARTTPAKLIAAWRDTIMVARPRPVAASPGTAWAAVVWGCLLGALSMRSTRWRGR